MKTCLKMIWLIVIVICASVSARAYDVSGYFLDVDMSRISVSPSGKYVAAYEAAGEAGLFTDGRIAIRSTQTGLVKYEIPVFNRDISWIEWVNDTDIAVYARGFNFTSEDKKAKAIGNRQDAINVYDIRNGRFDNIYRHVYMRGDENIPDVKLLGVDTKNSELHVLYKPVGAGKLQILGKNYHVPKTLLTGTRATLSWLLDADLNPTTRIDQGATSYTFKYYRREGSSNNWRHFYTENTLDASSRIVRPPEKSDTFQALYREDHEEMTGLYDLSIGSQFPLASVYRHPKFDLSGAKYFGPEKTLYYAYWWEDTLERKWFDSRHAAIAGAVGAKLPRQSNWHVEGVRYDVAGNDAYWLIKHHSPQRSASVSIWNVKANELILISEGKVRVDSATVPQKRRVNYRARDGRELHGYYTPGSRPSRHALYNGPAQLLVLPHAGPKQRDMLKWDSWSLHFASLGYDVFQPQFRGSTGFGRYFESLGHRQWGRLMQTDIEDGVDALVQNGTIDANIKRAILGQGYGGYAALIAATHTPDLYKCASSINGVSDLTAMLEHFNQSDPIQKYNYYQWEVMLGNPSEDSEELLDYSPSQYAEDITGELFLVHGRKNDVIPVAQSEIMHAAAIKAGVKSQLVRFRHMGHDNWSEEQEYDILSAVDGFIQRCMRPPPPPRPAKLVSETVRPDPGILQRPKGTGVEVR